MNEALNWRYAVKKFDSTAILSEKEIHQIIESIRLSPSSLGLQPYKVIVVENQELREKLIPVSWDQDKVAKSSHLLVLACYNKLDENFIDARINLLKRVQGLSDERATSYKERIMTFIKGMSPESQAEWIKKQAYIALGIALASLAQMKIDSCPMEGFTPSEYDRILGLEKSGLTTTLVLPIGRRAANDYNASLPKARNSLDEFAVFLK